MIYPDQLKTMQEEIADGRAYRLASEDAEFLSDNDLRPIRLQLELLKPERTLRQYDIRSTIVIFGSARTISPEEAEERLVRLEDLAHEKPGNPRLERDIIEAKRHLAYSRFYEEARLFAHIVSRRFQKEGRRDFVIVTGGGPGIMEAANQGAFEAGMRSIGLNINLPHEQHPNPFITPELAFRFQYFALRKMHFLLRARALVAFPGGYGTLDELFEVLTLVQTRKVNRIPIVLFGSKFWRQALNFTFLIDEGMISADDAELFTIVDKAEEAVAVLHEFYGGTPPE
jgi:uncharacterized protein (TIGR00730 family)